MSRIGAAVAVVALLAAAGPALGDDECLLKCPTRKGPFGQPERDKACVLKCLQEEETNQGTKGGAKPPAPSLRFTQSWNGSEELRRQQRAMKDLVDAIPDERFRAWAIRNVVFERVSQGPGSFKLGVRPGRIIVYDPFWTAGRSAQDSLLTFELAKALWFERINPGPREARPPRQVEFEDLYRRHQKAIEAMPFAAWRGADLAYLTDNDPQSWFGYALRAALFDLPAPSRAPDAYSAAEWAAIRRDWKQAQADVRRYVVSLLGPAKVE